MEPQFNEVPRNWDNWFIISENLIQESSRKTAKILIINNCFSLLVLIIKKLISLIRDQEDKLDL